jgi:hypothetical protein
MVRGMGCKLPITIPVSHFNQSANQMRCDVEITAQSGVGLCTRMSSLSLFLSKVHII